MKTSQTSEERKRRRLNRTRQRQRKYLRFDERSRFLEATSILPPKRKIFCEVIYYTGCRIQEAHDLCFDDFDLVRSVISIECLKIRVKGVFRDVPVPPYWLEQVEKNLQLKEAKDPYQLVWDFSLSTGYRSIKKAMKLADIHGPHANARGLRHSFCTLHVERKTNPKLIQRWFGHKISDTTMIYMDAVEEEERNAAKALW